MGSSSVPGTSANDVAIREHNDNTQIKLAEINAEVEKERIKSEERQNEAACNAKLKQTESANRAMAAIYGSQAVAQSTQALSNIYDTSNDDSMVKI